MAVIQADDGPALLVIPPGDPPVACIPITLAEEEPRSDLGPLEVKLTIRRYRLRQDGPVELRTIEIPWLEDAGQGRAGWGAVNLEVDLAGAWHAELRFRAPRARGPRRRRELRVWVVAGRAAGLATLAVAAIVVLALIWLRPITGGDWTSPIIGGALAIALSGQSGEAITDRIAAAFLKTRGLTFAGVLDLPRRAALFCLVITLLAILGPFGWAVLRNDTGSLLSFHTALLPTLEIEPDQEVVVPIVLVPRPPEGLAWEDVGRPWQWRGALLKRMPCASPLLVDLRDARVIADESGACAEGTVEIEAPRLANQLEDRRKWSGGDGSTGMLELSIGRHGEDPDWKLADALDGRLYLAGDHSRDGSPVRVDLPAFEPPVGIRGGSIEAPRNMPAGPLYLPTGANLGNLELGIASNRRVDQARLRCDIEPAPAALQLDLLALDITPEYRGRQLKSLLLSHQGWGRASTCEAGWVADGQGSAPWACDWRDDQGLPYCQPWYFAELHLAESSPAPGWNLQLPTGVSSRRLEIKDQLERRIGVVEVTDPAAGPANPLAGRSSCGPAWPETAGGETLTPTTLKVQTGEDPPFVSSWTSVGELTPPWVCLPDPLPPGRSWWAEVDGARWKAEVISQGLAGWSVRLVQPVLRGQPVRCLDAEAMPQRMSCDDCRRFERIGPDAVRNLPRGYSYRMCWR